MRLFERSSIVDALDLTVVHPESKVAILAGVIRRNDVLAAQPLPLQIRLRMSGVAYDLTPIDSGSPTGLDPSTARFDGLHVTW